MKKYIKWFLTIYVLAFIISFFIILKAFKDNIIFDEFSITALVYFAIMLIFMIVSWFVKQNPIFGIRISYTMDYEYVWNKTHKFFSIVCVFFLPLMFALIFFSSGWGRFILCQVVLLLPIIIAAIYAVIIGSKYDKQEAQKENEELKKQITKEQGYKIS